MNTLGCGAFAVNDIPDILLSTEILQHDKCESGYVLKSFKCCLVNRIRRTSKASELFTSECFMKFRTKPAKAGEGSVVFRSNVR